MAITASFEADFSQFNTEVEKAGGELRTFETQTAKTGTQIGTLSATARQFDSTLSAVGINIGPATKAIAEIEAVAGKSATALGVLGTAGATLSVAVAGWQIGRKIADALGTDELIGNAVAKWMGWGDVVKETAGAAADAVRYASEREITDTQAVSAELAAQAKQRAQWLADEKKEWDAATAIRDRFFGDDAIKKADDYAKAIGMLGGYLDSLTRDQLKELQAAMLAGIEAMTLSGRATDAQSSAFAKLAVEAGALLETLEPVVTVTEDLVKAQWEYALATDAALAAMGKVNAEADRTAAKAKEAQERGAGAGVGLGLVTDAGGVARDLFGRPVIGTPGLAPTMGVIVNVDGSVITNGYDLANTIGAALTASYRNSGRRLPV